MSSDDLNYWNVARKCIAAVWDAHARIYHGYEVIGMEHVPATGPTLIVYYHGAIPIDMYYFVARVCLERVSNFLATKKATQRIANSSNIFAYPFRIVWCTRWPIDFFSNARAGESFRKR